MAGDLPSVFRLACKVQEYPWGTVGPESRVARYASATPENEFQAKKGQTYAELWMGSAHQNGPSNAIIKDQTIPLKDVILQHPEAIYGKAVKRLTETARNKGQLPFLFKTLCAGKALPLQIHPHKELAEEMYKDDPEDLPDDNHKPEIGLALSEFWAFASFRPMQVIRDSVRRVFELREIMGKEEADKFLQGEISQDKLRSAVSKILQRGKDDEAAKLLVISLAKKCKAQGDAALGVNGDEGKEDQGLAEVFGMLNDDYEGDLGAFVCTFFMNLYKLQPGEAISVEAAGIHAWFRGDCIECMANSDNVLNSAFTEISQDDLDLFNKNFLAPTQTPADQHRVPSRLFKRGESGHTTRYFTPFDEFDMLRIQLGPNEKETHQPIEGPSVFLVEGGSGRVQVGETELELKAGVVALILAGKEAIFTAAADDSGMQIYRCFAE